MSRMTDTPFDCAMARSKQELARQLVEANAEIERLQAAKRRALALADERAKECVALRAALKPFAEWSKREHLADLPDAGPVVFGGPTKRNLIEAADAFNQQLEEK